MTHGLKTGFGEIRTSEVPPLPPPGSPAGALQKGARLFLAGETAQMPRAELESLARGVLQRSGRLVRCPSCCSDMPQERSWCPPRLLGDALHSFSSSLCCAHNHIPLCCLAILQSSSGKLATFLGKRTIACFVLCPLTPSLPPDELVSSVFNRSHQRETPSSPPPTQRESHPCWALASCLHSGG